MGYLGDGGEFELCVAVVNVPRKCRWCETRLNNENEMLDHVLSQHHTQCFERLDLKGEGVTQPILVCMVPERDFQEGRINVLSCSTTFELGVVLVTSTPSS